MIQKVHWKGKVYNFCNKSRIIHDSVHIYSYKTREEGVFLDLCLPTISCCLLHKSSFYFKVTENEHSLWTFSRSSWNSVSVGSALKGGTKWTETEDFESLTPTYVFIWILYKMAPKVHLVCALLFSPLKIMSLSYWQTDPWR